MLITPINKIQMLIDRLDNLNVLIAFMYFNVICTRFEKKESLSNKKRINNNLLKLFMRHYLKLAKECDYEIESDEEDYKIEHSHKRKKSNYFEDMVHLNNGEEI